MKSLYNNKEIRNHLDVRLLDCFCEQNTRNSWLQVSDIASWVFETNNPNPFQKNYTLRKLNSLVGPKNTASFRSSAFECSYDQDVEGSLLFRLKNPAAYIIHKRQASISDAVNAAAAHKLHNQEACSSAELEEFPF